MKEYKRLTMEGSIVDNIINCVVCPNKTEKYTCMKDKTNCLKAVINRLAELEDKIENGTLREVTPLNSEEAQYFAGKMEDYLNIPAMVCELIERKLKQGNFEEVVRYIIQRKKELQKNRQ